MFLHCISVYFDQITTTKFRQTQTVIQQVSYLVKLGFFFFNLLALTLRALRSGQICLKPTKQEKFLRILDKKINFLRDQIV